MAGKTVLVIDTDIDTEQQIMSTLETAGYLVFAAQTDDVLSENALKVSPSLLFFSAPASGAKGLETCRLIHENKAFRGIPIIVLTPFDEPMDPKYTELYGVVDILRIPFAAEDLLNKTEAALSGQPTVRRKEEAPVDRPEKAPAAAKAAPAPSPEPKPKVRVKVTPPPVIEDIPLEKVFEDIGGRDQPSFTPPPAKKKSNTIILVSLVLVLVVLAGAAAFFLLKDRFFPPAKQAAVTRPAQPAPKPEAPAEQPTPSPTPAQPQSEKTSPSPTAGQQPQPVAQAKPSPDAAAAKPAGAPAATEQGKIGFSVQLGAFKESVHAEALAKKFKAKGYDAFVKKAASKDKGPVFKVLVGKYSDRKQGQKMAETLRAKEKVQAVIYSD